MVFDYKLSLAWVDLYLNIIFSALGQAAIKNNDGSRGRVHKEVYFLVSLLGAKKSRQGDVKNVENILGGGGGDTK